MASLTVAPNIAYVTVGATQQITFTARDTAGNPITGLATGWSSSDASIASVDGHGVITGRRIGSANITLLAGGLRGTVTTSVMPQALAVGDSVEFEMRGGAGPKITLSLTAGDTVDVGLWLTGSGFFAPQLITVANGSLQLQQAGSSAGGNIPVVIGGAMVAPTTGKYLVQPLVDPYGECHPMPCPIVAHGIVRTRRSAPIIVKWYPTFNYERRGTVGTNIRDSVSLINAGLGSATVSAAHLPSWLTSAPASAALTGPKAQKFFVFTATGSTPGSYSDSVTFAGAPNDVWNSFWPHRISASVRLDEPTDSVAVADTIIRAIVDPANKLFGATASKLYRVDPATGQLTMVSAALPAHQGIFFGADSALYASNSFFAGGADSTTVSTMTADGTWKVVAQMRGAAGVAVTSDHTIFATHGGSQPSMTSQTSSGASVSSNLPGLPDAGLLVDPTSGALYYTSSGHVHRWNPSTRTDVDVGAVAGVLVAVDARGLLYTYDGRIQVYDSAARQLDTRWQAIDPIYYYGLGVAVDSATIYLPHGLILGKLATKQY